MAIKSVLRPSRPYPSINLKKNGHNYMHIYKPYPRLWWEYNSEIRLGVRDLGVRDMGADLPNLSSLQEYYHLVIR